MVELCNGARLSYGARGPGCFINGWGMGLFQSRIKGFLLTSCIINSFSAVLVASPQPSFFRVEVPNELRDFSSAARVARPSISSPEKGEKLLFGRLNFLDAGQGKLKLNLDRARTVSFSRMPEVPALFRAIALKPGTEATAELVNMVVEETSTSIPLKETEEALLWAPDHQLSFLPQHSQRYFPGKWIDSHRQKGNLLVNLFPVQVDLHTGKVVRLVSAELKVVEVPNLTFALPEIRLEELLQKPALIVTTQNLKNAALDLASYHEQNLGIKTDVVTVEDIAVSESVISEDDLPSGYKTVEGRDDAVTPYDAKNKTGYQYELSRKIDNYLQKRFTDSSPLRYVTILGNATDVPPSYYYAYKSPFGFTYSPTDACYGAVKKCSDPKVAVGRLPFASAEEVKAYIAKIESWRTFAQNTDSELSLFGGKAFPRSDIYVGELGTLQTIQSDKADWRGVKKHFKTKQTYDRKALLDLVSGNSESSFAYYLDHGNGNQWYAEESMITSKDIAQAKETATTHPSLVVSIACTNSAFDETITKETILAPVEKYGSVSIGVALMRSPVGAVAYLGSNRVALGTPNYEFDTFGNLKVNNTNYSLQLLEGFYTQYGTMRKGRLGDHSLKALQAYSFEYGNDMNKDQNAWTYFITELLGDPVIPLPTRNTVENNFALAKSTFTLDNSIGIGFPQLHLKGQTEISLGLEVLNPIQATLLRVLRNDFGGYQGEEIVTTKEFVKAEQAQNLALKVANDLTEGSYFLRLENKTGVPRERQVHFTVVKE